MSGLPPIPEGFQLDQHGPALPPIPEGFKLVEPSAMDTAKGLVKAGGIGIVKGAIGMIGGAGDVANLASEGADYVGIPQGVKDFFGGMVLGKDRNDIPRSNEKSLKSLVAPPKQSPILGSRALREGIEQQFTGPLYEPKTVPEKYMQTAGEFVPAALTGPGGLVRKLATQAVIPGFVSETAGQLPGVKDTKLEPWVRGGAAVASGGVATALSRPGGTANALRSQLPEWVTDAHIGQAEGLIQDAAARGINLTWSEALSQVTGRPVLTDAQRMLESAPHSRGRMQDVFGERPQQIENAVRHELDQISPGTAQPSTIGHAVGDAAENTLSDVRRTINNATDPLYQAAEGVLLTRPEMAQVVRLPGYREARNAVRNDPQLNRYVAHLPDNSVGFLNEVKKYLDQAAENATHPMTAQRNAQRGAGYTRDAADVRQSAIDASNRAAPPGLPGTYEIALNAQQQARQQFLEPLLQGPLGRVAGKDTTTQKAIEVLFPKQPLAGSADEIATAVGAVAHRNPWAATQLVRAHLESELHNAFVGSGRGQEAAQFAGARFALNTAGSPNAVTQQFENIHAALGALPGGQARAAAFAQLLPILQATGTRTGKGSLTSFNTREIERLSTGGSLQNVVKHVTSPGEWWHLGEHAISRWQLGRNLDQLAAILTNPQSGNYLRTIARMPNNSPRILTVLGKMIAASTTEQRAKKP